MESPDQVTLQIPSTVFWPLVTLLAILGLSALVFALLPRAGVPEPRRRFAAGMERLGLAGWPLLITAPLALIWTALVGVLLFGLLWVGPFLLGQDFSTTEGGAADLRWTLLAITAVTAALSAAIALPFTLLRTHFNRRSTEAEEEGLLTDRINKAVEGLGAEKEVNRLGRNVTYTRGYTEFTDFQRQCEPLQLPEGTTGIKYGEWRNVGRTEPNLEVRIGAIYALERIARRNLDVHIQIMEILCTYIRQNSPASGAMDGPPDWPPADTSFDGSRLLREDEAPPDWLLDSEDDGPVENGWEVRRQAYSVALRRWTAKLKPRTDIQATLEVIGRRSKDQRRREARYRREDQTEADRASCFVFDHPPDWTESADDMSGDRRDVEFWKQEMDRYRGYRLDLRATNLQGADLSGLNFAGARLEKARMHGAELGITRLQGADLRKARLQGADLYGGRLQGADLEEARMQAADLEEARLQRADLGGARLQGALLVRARLQGADLRRARLQGALLGEARLRGARLGAARLQGAHLTRAELQRAMLFETRLQGTVIDWANLQGAMLEELRIDESAHLLTALNRGSALKSMDLTQCRLSRNFVEEAFGDGSVKLPDSYKAGEPPLEHWPKEVLDHDAFVEAWRAWQVEIGFRRPEDRS